MITQDFEDLATQDFEGLIRASLADGSVQWTSGRIGSGNLLLADGKLIVLTEDGELLLAPAVSKGYKVLHRQQILGFETRAHFAISNGKLFARDKKRLVSMDLTVARP